MEKHIAFNGITMVLYKYRKGETYIMSKIHITVPDELKEKIKFIAEKKSRSMNFIVNEALIYYTNKFKRKKK